MLHNAAVDLSVNSPGGAAESLNLPKKPHKNFVSSATTVLPPCRVCNATASGYHYGANTCEACKAFFRRSIGNEHAIKPCQRDGNCAQSPKGKIACSDCRHKKCLLLGMAKDGCRKGRYTYEKRTRDTKEIRRNQADKCITKVFKLQNCAKLAATLASQFAFSFPKHQSFITDKEILDCRVEALFTENHREGDVLREILYSPGHTPSAEAMQWYRNVTEVDQQLAQISEASTDDKLNPLLHDIIFQAWSFEAEKEFHGLTAFAKSLSGFSNLLINDRIILLKGGRTDCMNIMKHKLVYLNYTALCHYCHESGDLFLFPLMFIGQAVNQEFADNLCRFTARIQRLNLTSEDMAVLLAFVILTSDREELQRSDQVERLQDTMLAVLQFTLKKNHPDKSNILPETLLLLPMLRESSEINKKCLAVIRSQVRPEVTPLLAEMIQA